MIARYKKRGYQGPNFKGDALPDTLTDTLQKNGIFHWEIEPFRVSQGIYLILKSSAAIEGQTAAHGGSL